MPAPSRGISSRSIANVSGNGSFVIRLLADNCSWIYLSDANGANAQLVGAQLKDVRANPTPTLTGTVWLPVLASLYGLDLRVLAVTIGGPGLAMADPKSGPVPGGAPPGGVRGCRGRPWRRPAPGPAGSRPRSGGVVGAGRARRGGLRP